MTKLTRRAQVIVKLALRLCPMTPSLPLLQVYNVSNRVLPNLLLSQKERQILKVGAR